MPGIYFVGVDVGTGSARAALVNAHGRVLQVHVKKIDTWNPQPDHYEQSSDNIWQAVCECVHVNYYIGYACKARIYEISEHFEICRVSPRDIQAMKLLASDLMQHALWSFWIEKMSHYRSAPLVYSSENLFCTSN